MEFGGVTAGSSTATFGIAIRRVSGTGTPLLKLIDFTNNIGTVNIEHPTHSDAIAPDAAAAKGAFTVGAVNYATPTTPESFTSRGPVTRLFDASGTPLATPDVRQKPDVVGPDGVSTSVPGFGSFIGTSAATPAIAGIACAPALVQRSLTPDELFAILRNPANDVPCTSSQPTIDCGAGFVLADKALAQARDTTPPVVTPTITPAVPDGANGWYTGHVTVSWSETDPESPISNPAGCVTTSPGDVSETITCSATSAGGTTTVPVSVKRDSTPPSPPRSWASRRRRTRPTAFPRSISCSSFDTVSDVTSCVVTGFDGEHRPAHR